MRHLIYAPLNILTRAFRKAGVLGKIEDIETTELLGVGKVSEFTSQQLLSFDACLRCGRCEEACPSNFSGMDYSPKKLIQSLRTAMLENLVSGNGKSEKELMGSVIPEAYAWQCTTCGACIAKCPAFINPVDEIVDLRRYQVLTTGQMPKSVGDTMRNMERQGNPWGMPPDNRMAWAEGLDVRELAPGEETDVLLFTGCAALRQADEKSGLGLRRAGLRRDVLRRDRPAHGARVPVPGVCQAKHRDLGQGQVQARGDGLPALLQYAQE
jgi:heterodisulfide reductase subunit C